MNEVTELNAYPLLQIAAALDKLRRSRYLITFDLKDGYWQVPLTSKNRPVTAFIVSEKGFMQFHVMTFGLHSAPVFQRLLDTVLGPEFELNVFLIFGYNRVQP